MEGDPALVGRDEELRLLAGVRRDEPGGGVVLEGPVGIGKTALARHFLAALPSEVDRLWLGATRAAAIIPFGAFAPLLAAAGPAGEAPSVDVLARAIETVRGRPGVVIGVDDAQLLDDGSAALLHQLALEPACFVVITVRAGNPCPDAVTALGKDRILRRVEVQALSVGEVEALLVRRLRGPVEASVVRRVADASAGNPLYVTELLDAGLAAGHLVADHGVWSWEGPLAVGTRLTELVDGRLADLAEDERDLVELVALGEPLPLAAAECLAEPRALRGLVTAGILGVDAGDCRPDLRLGHPLYGEVLRSVTDGAPRREIHRRLADALEATTAGDLSDRLRIAAWRLDATGEVEPGTLVVAAREAIRRQDQALAERLADAAAARGGGNAALIELAESLYWQERHDEVEAILGGIDRAQSPPAEQIRIAVCRASNLFWGFGRADEAVRELEGVAGVDGGEEAVGHAALIELLAGHADRAHRRAVEVLATDALGPRAAARAYGALIQAQALVGRPEDALRGVDAGMAAALAAWPDLPTPIGGVVIGQFLGLLLGGRLIELEGLVGGLHAESVDKDADDFRGIWTFMVGRAALAVGRLDDARRLLAEAVALLEHRDVGQLRPWCLGCLAQAAGQAGRADEAHAAAAAAGAAGTSIVVWEVEVGLGEAWAAWAGGDPATAGQRALQAAEGAVRSGQAASEVLALHDALRLGAPGAAERLVTVAADVQGAFAAAASTHAAAGGDGAGLDAAAEAFAAIGARLAGAECALEAAMAHRRAGRSGSALSAGARAAELLGGLGEIDTPAVRQAAAPPELALLTDREREVADLAASGLTKREIAERLYLSVRTVGNHLNHVYGKLGFSDRDRLARLLGAPTLDE